MASGPRRAQGGGDGIRIDEPGDRHRNESTAAAAAADAEAPLPAPRSDGTQERPHGPSGAEGESPSAAAAAAARKGKAVLAPSPLHSPTRSDDISSPASSDILFEKGPGESTSADMLADGDSKLKVTWKKLPVEAKMEVPKVTRPLDVKSAFDGLSMEQQWALAEDMEWLQQIRAQMAKPLWTKFKDGILNLIEADEITGQTCNDELTDREKTTPCKKVKRMEQAQMAGAEGRAAPSRIVGASPTARARETKWRAPYTIPEWSAAPSHHFCFEVVKDGAVIEEIDLSRKGSYMFGKYEICDYVLQHPSISRYHAVIQFSKNGKVFIYDVGSIHGSFVNDNQIKKKLYTKIYIGDVIRFGGSTRLYTLRGPSELMYQVEADEITRQTCNDELTDREKTTPCKKVKRMEQEKYLLKFRNARIELGDDGTEAALAREVPAEVEADEITRQTCIDQLTDRQKTSPCKKVKPMEQMTCSREDSIADSHESYKQLVSNEGRQFITPQSKLLSKDTKRKALSVGSKRSASMSYDKTVNCQRVLSYHDCSTSGSKVALDEYIKHGISKKTKVPFMSKKVKMGKEDIKLVLLNVFASIVDLHYDKLSLKGVFGLKNFMISIYTKRVSLEGVTPREYTQGDSALDKSAFLRMIKEIAEDELPLDIEIWLECIKKGSHNSVLKRHINMQHSNIIFGDFSVMFHAMQELKKHDMSRFKELLDRVRGYDDWGRKKFIWSVLQDNRHHKYPNLDSEIEGRFRDCEEDFTDTVFGLMQKIRNCWEHPAKTYKHFLMAVLICQYPRLLSEVQEVMYDLGYMPHLDTEQIISQDEAEALNGL